MSFPQAAVAETPRALWVELTSRCPLDCVFCSRKMRRSAGRHMPWEIYRSLVESLVAPRTLALNYSGESLFYPRLLDAIALARSRGAFVEMVSAFGAAPAGTARELALSGIGRLSASVHAADPARYREIYGRGSPADLAARVREFQEGAHTAPVAPSLDFSFVAMDRNLDQLEPVAALAAELGVSDITVFPVLRRDDIAERFETELDGARAHRPEFCARLESAVTTARGRHPGVRITLGNPVLEAGCARLGEVPGPYPGPLPDGARIHTCEQNPWETAHVLSDGEVVPCEALDRSAMGNLGESTLAEIWHGPRYRDFRRRYSAGEVPECRICPWKRAFLPAPPASEILGSRGRSAQLLRGWHEPSGEAWVWSTQQAAALLAPREGSRTLHVCGALPPGLPGEPNRLDIACNGVPLGEVANPWEEVIPFGLDFDVPAGAAAPWQLEFRTRHVYRPRERGSGNDVRDLGFAMTLVASKLPRDGALEARRAAALLPLARAVARADRWGARLRRLPFLRRRPSGRPTADGVSVVIPERDNPAELAECLAAVERAALRAGEPVEIIVSASGGPASRYAELRRLHPAVRWMMSARPLAFHEAVRRGLAVARYDWVYLVNNDAAPEPDALAELLPLREVGVFAIGSQIEYKDATRFREETNWGGFEFQDGLAAIADRIPTAAAPTECFYVGGGASLFQRAVLRRLAGASAAYAPFYWEDVEWGWRARKLGYRVLFCPSSMVRHRHRATIGRLHTAEEVARVSARNGLLFQFRNMTASGSLERLLEEVARLPDAEHFTRGEVIRRIAAARVWNWLAPVPDEELLRASAAMRP